MIYDNPAGVQIYTNAVRTGVFNNTIYRNAENGIHVQYYGSGTIIRQQHRLPNGTNYRDSGSGSAPPQFDHNLTANPMFVNENAVRLPPAGE